MLDFHPTLAIPALIPGEVQLWRVNLAEVTADEAGLLSLGEWEQARRTPCVHEAQRFIAAQAALRTILGAQLGIEPPAIRFRRGAHGQLELDAETLLRFNVSQSGDLMLLAITYGREIGVDLEARQQNLLFEMLSEHYFDPRDAWSIRTAAAAERADKFYDLWTRTEAQLQAERSGKPAHTTVIAPDRWSLLSLTPAEGYAAALAVEGASFKLNCWAWRS